MLVKNREIVALSEEDITRLRGCSTDDLPNGYLFIDAMSVSKAEIEDIMPALTLIGISTPDPFEPRMVSLFYVARFI